RPDVLLLLLPGDPPGAEALYLEPGRPHRRAARWRLLSLQRHADRPLQRPTLPRQADPTRAPEPADGKHPEPDRPSPHGARHRAALVHRAEQQYTPADRYEDRSPAQAERHPYRQVSLQLFR